MKNIKNYEQFNENLNEGEKDFEQIKNEVLDNEETIAKEEKHPGLDKKLKKIEKMRDIDNPKNFITQYKRLTGATNYDLPEDLIRFN